MVEVPVPPPRKSRREEFYATLPASLKTECLVRSKIMVDDEALRQRQEIVRSTTPAQLSEIHGFSDIPLPTFIENMTVKRPPRQSKGSDKEQQEGEQGGDNVASSSFFAKLPESLKAECLVRAKVEDPEIQKLRAEIIKTKSVAELSQVTSLSDIPLPSPIEQLIRKPGAVERKKRFREK